MSAPPPRAPSSAPPPRGTRQRCGSELDGDEREHRAARERKGDRQQPFDVLDEEVREQRARRLGRARGDGRPELLAALRTRMRSSAQRCSSPRARSEERWRRARTGSSPSRSEANAVPIAMPFGKAVHEEDCRRRGSRFAIRRARWPVSRASRLSTRPLATIRKAIPATSPPRLRALHPPEVPARGGRRRRLRS